VVKTRLSLLDTGNLVLHELVVGRGRAGSLLLLLLGDLGGVRLGHLCSGVGCKRLERGRKESWFGDVVRKTRAFGAKHQSNK